MPPSPRTRSALLLTAALLLAASPAGAHGGLPRAFEILVEPGNPTDVLLRSDLWGFFRTQDGGVTWQWTCAETYGVSSLSVNHSHFALVPGGRLVVATAFKGVRFTDDGCTWKESPEFSGELAVDVRAANGAVVVLTSTNTGGDAGVETRLWTSTDGGSNYAAGSAALSGNFAASALALAPSDGKRVYVLGRPLLSSEGMLERSDDGGGSFRALPIPVTDGLPVLRIAGVHPTRPDVLFLWVDAPEDILQNAPDAIWGTTDGGVTWTEIYDGKGDLPGFAFSPDGSQIAVSGPLDGLEIALLDAAFASGQLAFTQTFTDPARPDAKDRALWGLHWDGTGLTAGTDNFTAKGVPAFTYGLWTDERKTFDRLMSICDARPPACAASSTVALACQSVYDDPLGGFLQDYLGSARCADTGVGTGTGGNADAGRDAPPPVGIGLGGEGGGTGAPDAGPSGAGAASRSGAGGGAAASRSSNDRGCSVTERAPCEGGSSGILALGFVAAAGARRRKTARARLEGELRHLGST